jgi:hypothetical protein
MSAINAQFFFYQKSLEELENKMPNDLFNVDKKEKQIFSMQLLFLYYNDTNHTLLCDDMIFSSINKRIKKIYEHKNLYFDLTGNHIPIANTIVSFMGPIYDIKSMKKEEYYGYVCPPLHSNLILKDLAKIGPREHLALWQFDPKKTIETILSSK